jgi:hypothetical protein
MGTPTRRGIEQALQKLEAAAVAKARSIRPEPFDEADCLDWFAQAGRAGEFAREPDFPVALAMLREELAKARASTDPPFDPPEDFQPEQRHPHTRRENWRSSRRFPKLSGALTWLWEMLGRIERHIPPCSEAEFADLAAWFAAREAGLRAIAGPSELLVAGGGRRTWCLSVRYALREGPRADGAGQLAEDIRQLKARYGERAEALAARQHGES